MELSRNADYIISLCRKHYDIKYCSDITVQSKKLSSKKR